MYSATSSSAHCSSHSFALSTQPQPLFKKLDPKEVEGFRKKFSGSSTDATVKAAADESKLLELLESLKLKNELEITQLVTAQGDKVRKLKETKADKTVIAQEVKILLALKKSQSEKAAGAK